MVPVVKPSKVIKRKSRGKGRIIKKGISNSINSSGNTQLKTLIKSELEGTLLKGKKNGKSKSLKTLKRTELNKAVQKGRKSGTSTYEQAKNKTSPDSVISTAKSSNKPDRGSSFRRKSKKNKLKQQEEKQILTHQKKSHAKSWHHKRSIFKSTRKDAKDIKKDKLKLQTKKQKLARRHVTSQKIPRRERDISSPPKSQGSSNGAPQKAKDPAIIHPVPLFGLDKSQPEPKKILEALDVLRSQLAQQINHLFPDEPLVIYLNIASMKICKGSKIVRITLPYLLLDESADVCLFIADLERGRKSDPALAIEQCKELLKSNGITKISEVITLGQVRRDFGEFETKRALCSRFDFFLSEAKINGHLIHHLGKQFYSRKKIPVPVTLNHNTLKEHIDKALSKSYFVINSTGNLFTMKVGHTNLTNDQICENIMTVVHELQKVFPGGWNNVLRLELKGQKTSSLPIYVSTRPDHSVTVPKAYKEPKAAVSYTDDLDWIGKVRVSPYGSVVVTKRDPVEKWQRKGLNDYVKPPKQSKKKKVSDLEDYHANFENMNSIDEGMSAFAYENLQNTSDKGSKSTKILKGNGGNQEKRDKRRKHKMEYTEKGDDSLSDDDDDQRKVQFYEQAYLEDLAKSRDEEEGRKANETLKGNGNYQEKRKKRIKHKMENTEKGDDSLSDDDDDDQRKVQFYEQAYLENLAKSRDEEELQKITAVKPRKKRRQNKENGLVISK